MEAPDKTLINQFLGGDREAFGRIVVRWERRVLNLAFRLSSDLEEARDIRQQTFLKALEGLPAFNGEAQFSTWLYRIVVNLCRDRIRAAQSRESALRALETRQGGHSSVLPDCDAERAETARKVAEAVAVLPEREREVVVLRHYQGCTFSEIAEIAGAPASTIKSRMLRGLQHLRVLLKDIDL
jgi:RNA polymerase sigma-70 factor (ECF subfamily)